MLLVLVQGWCVIVDGALSVLALARARVADLPCWEHRRVRFGIEDVRMPLARRLPVEVGANDDAMSAAGGARIALVSARYVQRVRRGLGVVPCHGRCGVHSRYCIAPYLGEVRRRGSMTP